MAKPLFGWRWHVASEQGPKSPTTRLVLLTVALHMSVKGDSAYPKLTTLASETGLNKATVSKHIEIAIKDGWLTRSKMAMRGDGQAWNRVTYCASFPTQVRVVVDDRLLKASRSDDEADRPDTEGSRSDAEHTCVMNSTSNSTEKKLLPPDRLPWEEEEKAAERPDDLLGKARAVLAIEDLHAGTRAVVERCAKQLASGRGISGPQRDVLLDIVAEQATKAERAAASEAERKKAEAAVNVPSKAAQLAQAREDLDHDEAVLVDRQREGGYIPPQLVKTCGRRRARLGLEIPTWLEAMTKIVEAEEKTATRPRRKKLTQREVEARLKKIADQSKDDDAAEAVA